MEVALDASNQMLALCSDAYFDREKGYSRAERQSMFWEDPTNNEPLLILVKVADCKFPRLIAQKEYISLIGLQRPEAAAKLVGELQSEQARTARLKAQEVDRSRAQPANFNVQGTINPLFTGRDAELALLHDRVRSGTATAITAVQGMGGIGKTSLAREYAHRFGTAARFGGVWWIDAETQSGILAAYDQLAERLGDAVPRDADQEKTGKAVCDWFKELKEKVEQAFADAFDWPNESDLQQAFKRPAEDTHSVPNSINMKPTDVSNDTHILTTKQLHPVKSNCLKNKATAGVAPELPTSARVGGPEEVDLDISWSTHTNKRGSEVDIPMLMASCPHFAEMARGLQGYLKSWNDVHRAAAQLRPMAGISEDAWNVAQKVMGPGVAAAAIALIFDKHTDGEVKSPGGYLRGMVEKARAGELHLDRSFYGRLNEVRAV